MNINRRKLRASLGSRTTRRNGTKTKVLKGASGKRPPKSRYPRRNKARVRTLLAAKIRKALNS
jgi:hypothetical protein